MTVESDIYAWLKFCKSSPLKLFERLNDREKHITSLKYLCPHLRLMFAILLKMKH